MCIVQIVPRLSPVVDGVGDYALNLARQLLRDFSINTHFIVSDPTWQGATKTEEFSVSQVNEHSVASLLSLLPGERQHSTVVLLHYVNYGYAKRGCPFWLISSLERWRTASVNRSLVTMFHELYAFGPPWASSFWLSPLQKQLAARLAVLSDRCLTSRQAYAKTLHKLSRGKHTATSATPVFSNIGEPEQLPPLQQRDRRLVVFGHQNARLQVYQQCCPALEKICQALGIVEIYDIGVSTGLELSQINGIPLVKTGVIKATEISEILLNSIASFANFPPPEYLAKSTVFAAYCAHGLIPILTTSSTTLTDGLQAGKHYWVADDQVKPLCLETGQAIANNAYAWYQTHKLSVQAEIFASHLGRQP